MQVVENFLRTLTEQQIFELVTIPGSVYAPYFGMFAEIVVQRIFKATRGLIPEGSIRDNIIFIAHDIAAGGDGLSIVSLPEFECSKILPDPARFYNTFGYKSRRSMIMNHYGGQIPHLHSRHILDNEMVWETTVFYFEDVVILLESIERIGDKYVYKRFNPKTGRLRLKIESPRMELAPKKITFEKGGGDGGDGVVKVRGSYILGATDFEDEFQI